MPTTNLQQGDCLVLIKSLPNESVDIILTDPPYLYLKNQKLERVFDEKALFEECKRVLKPNGFVVMFGRGRSFYRWNTILLEELNFTFKEEIIWDKSQTSSPLLNLGRVHETVSILCKSDKGVILKNKIPYLEMKAGDLASIQQDVKRICGALNNPKEFARLQEYLKSYESVYSEASDCNFKASKSGSTKDDLRGTITVNSISKGLTEKSILKVPRLDYEKSEFFTKHHATTDERLAGSRAVDSMQSVCQGLNEKSIIVPEEPHTTIFEELRNHYDSVHPTQKPVRLLERLLLVLARIDTPTVVLDPFMGSGSTAIACQNLGFDFTGYEIDSEYFKLASERVQNSQSQQKLFD